VNEPYAIADRVEVVFRRIHRERMQDIPLLNPRLAVETVGIRATPVGWAGVLITPWFINLILLPNQESRGELDDVEAVGRKTLHLFPAGRFEFIASYETELGPFEMCSLFSPVLEFATQEAARHAAQGALEALFKDSESTHPPACGMDSEDDWLPNGLPARGTPVHVTRRGLLWGGRPWSAPGNASP
jgi:[NiFe] hydrogenase assembly HybE family chaperone